MEYCAGRAGRMVLIVSGQYLSQMVCVCVKLSRHDGVR